MEVSAPETKIGINLMLKNQPLMNGKNHRLIFIIHLSSRTLQKNFLKLKILIVLTYYALLEILSLLIIFPLLVISQ